MQLTRVTPAAIAAQDHRRALNRSIRSTASEHGWKRPRGDQNPSTVFAYHERPKRPQAASHI